MRNLSISALLLFCLLAVAQTPTEKPAPGDVRVNPKDGLKYVWIPPGTFQMGCSPGDNECTDDEKPAHNVTLTKGFWMGQTEVPQAAYQRVKGVNPSQFKGDQRPVETVTWDDASSYCSAVGMRLPTEAEWEYAARAGSTAARYGSLNSVAWHSHNTSGTPTRNVGLKQANAWGLHDMLGNVWEWTADWYGSDYYARSESQDLQGPPSGEYKTLRGGSWLYKARGVRVSNRFKSRPGDRDDDTGFRCVGE